MYPPPSQMRNQLRELNKKIKDRKKLSREDHLMLTDTLRGLIDEVDYLREETRRLGHLITLLEGKPA